MHAAKERWLSERLKRYAEAQKNTQPDDAPWEKQAARRKKEKRGAQKRSAAEKRTKAKVADVLAALDALSEATPPMDPAKKDPPNKEPPNKEPPKEDPMEIETEAERNAKRKNEGADPAGKAAKAAAAAGAGA